MKDFEFIKIEINEKKISGRSKDVYKKLVKDLITKAVFEFGMNLKRTSYKLNKVEYWDLEIQQYWKKYQLKHLKKSSFSIWGQNAVCQ